MKIKEILSKAMYNDSIMQEVVNANPKQILSDELRIPVWKISYKYTTNRGNEKIGIKYMFLFESDYDIIDNEFNYYINEYNNKYPYKKISNVKILDAQYMDKLILQLD